MVIRRGDVTDIAWVFAQLENRPWRLGIIRAPIWEVHFFFSVLAFLDVSSKRVI